TLLTLIKIMLVIVFFVFTSRRRHTRSKRDWSSDVCSSDLTGVLEKAFTVSVTNPSTTSASYLKLVSLAIDDAGRFYSVNYSTTRSEERRVGKECRSRLSLSSLNLMRLRKR